MVLSHENYQRQWFTSLLDFWKWSKNVNGSYIRSLKWLSFWKLLKTHVFGVELFRLSSVLRIKGAVWTAVTWQARKCFFHLYSLQHRLLCNLSLPPRYLFCSFAGLHIFGITVKNETHLCNVTPRFWNRLKAASLTDLAISCESHSWNTTTWQEAILFHKPDPASACTHKAVCNVTTSHFFRSSGKAYTPQKCRSKVSSEVLSKAISEMSNFLFGCHLSNIVNVVVFLHFRFCEKKN